MRKEALWSLPLLAGLVVAFAGCPAKDNPPKIKKPADAAPSTASGGYGGAKHAPVDPIKANGPVFEGWPQPKLAIVITGEQDGYIEPCGCAGLENQKGGLARRHTMLRELARDGWPTITVDVGGLIDRFGPQASIKYQITADAMHTMGYAAIAFGAKDLRLPAEGLVAVAGGDDSPFVSANVNLFDLTKSYRVIEAGGMKVGITSILGDQYQREINNDQIKLSRAESALAAIVPKLEAESDYRILLAHATPAESAALAEKFPQFDVVVTAGGAEEPPHEMRAAAGGKTLLVEVGHKGKYAIVLGLYDDPQEPVRYQRVPLDSRYSDSPDMKQLMVAYQGQLEQLGLAGLGIRAKTHPRAAAQGDPAAAFVGAAKCGECHKTAHGVWSKTRHAQATHSLEKASPPRMHDPECLSCHVTGWSPQEFLPFEGGFSDLDSSPLLAGNGCENCHGPGGGHVAAEAGKDLVLRDRMRQSLRLTKATVELNICVKCHDDDNSPKFKFDEYWPKVEHKGKN